MISWPADREFRGRIWGGLVRAGVLLLAGWSLHRPGFALTVTPAWWGLTAAAVALSLLEWGPLRRWHSAWEQAVHYAGDVALISAAIAWVGADPSQLSPIYLLAVAGAGASSGLGGGLACGLLAALSSPGALWWSHSRAALDALDGGQITVLSLVYLLTGALSGTLAQHVREHRVALVEARRRLEQMQLDTDCIVRNMSSGLLTLDLDGRIGLCNPAAEDILGIRRGSAAGQQHQDALPAGLQAFTEILDAAIDLGETAHRQEVDVVHSSGREVPLGVSTSILRESDGRRRGVVAVFQDLTGAREQSRRARRQETLAGIGELAAGIAHEIRNCLNPITGSIELLNAGVPMPGEGDRLMELITREGQRLNQFIAELLDFSRMEELHASPVDLGELLEEVGRLLECHPRRGEEVRIRVVVGEGAAMRVDSEQLKRVLVNLGVNALEATHEAGEVTLQLMGPGAWVRPGEIELVVEDEGVGIRADHLGHVFEPFFTTKQGGTGLGLALARQVVERHGGRVTVQNRAERGTRVSVALPAELLVENPAAA